MNFGSRGIFKYRCLLSLCCYSITSGMQNMILNSKSLISSAARTPRRYRCALTGTVHKLLVYVFLGKLYKSRLMACCWSGHGWQYLELPWCIEESGYWTQSCLLYLQLMFNVEKTEINVSNNVTCKMQSIWS